jgi:phosphoribosylanthranilate isomerase
VAHINLRTDMCACTALFKSLSGIPMEMRRTRLKVCCIASIEEARLAIELGADALGLVAKMPSGPGPIPDELIAEIARAIPPPIATFLLTSETEPRAVVDHVRRTSVNTVQLVDDEVTDSVYQALRRDCPATRIVQVIHVRSNESVQRAIVAGKIVDALLLDSGNPVASTKELGGTGRVHDWEMSREIVARASKPVFLAGGINANNVGEAIRRVKPFGIDLCSGVRVDGKLDRDRLQLLVHAMRAADKSTSA